MEPSIDLEIEDLALELGLTRMREMTLAKRLRAAQAPEPVKVRVPRSTKDGPAGPSGPTPLRPRPDDEPPAG